MDWLAERYVILWTKTVFFVSNPTQCGWIEFFHAAGVVLGTGWMARALLRLYRTRRLSLSETRPVGACDARLTEAFFAASDGARSRLGKAAAPRCRRSRLRIHETCRSLAANAGLLHPTIVVSRDLIERLRADELRAVLAHELVHVVRRDNLKRVLLEALCWFLPVVIWLSEGLRLAVSSRGEFFAVLVLSILAALALRAAALPLVGYWQERRADEWAALVVGDRLTVASALVATASVHPRTRLAPVPASAFAVYQSPVSSRVRRLVDDDAGSTLLVIDRLFRTGSRSAAVALGLVAALAVHRAESRGLVGSIQITPCEVRLEVREGAPRPPAPCRSASRG